MSARAVVDRVSVQVSRYSVANGGADQGVYYAVEVLFPDGSWSPAGYHDHFACAQLAAAREARLRNAALLLDSIWPGRSALAGGGA
ncbi:MAG: hypothetical protein Q4G24_10735 [Paracoccus sp. (in: a-proteobacteria)]|uniref:hypothetical protein n=1 Tax=Paracoccus sp. TaxID=267 RepID=UPI0026E0798E|nr:hypothetical protein [Paracoccus sp. (in: a-proteobacteria)]MDO5621934.1 hypothetical protein [Paracoccus sp. (in: a-proteobacteria)]